jgi:tetratricopeptide (TPR) repeat protein
MKTELALFMANNGKSRLACIHAGLVIALILMLAPALRAATNSYTAQITQARLFAQPLVWVGSTPPDQDEAQALWTALGLNPDSKNIDPVAGAENFIQTHPDSAWVPSLQANLARYYRSQGRYSAAINYWQKAWAATKDSSDSPGRSVADYTLAYWTQLLSSLGRVDELQQLISAVNGRQLSDPEFQKQFDLVRQAATIMKHDPGVSYRCGSLALYQVASALKIKTDLNVLMDMPSPETGFSLASLMNLSAKYNLGLVAVKRPDGPGLIVPSLVHWSQK